MRGLSVSETYDSPSGRLQVCVKKEEVRLEECDDAHPAQEGNINMTHQQGGGIPHAWLLTKHEMFVFSVCGTVCGYAHSKKTRGKIDPDPHAVPPSLPCSDVREGSCRPLTKDTDIE